jgi:uncharacterized membrane protein YcjF (UPF0283 family)
MAVVKFSRPIPDIVTDLLSQFMTLVRKEGELARTEISDNIARAAAGLGLIIGGAVLLMPALVILLQAAVAALTDRAGLQAWASALIVGGVALLVGIILLLIGVSRLKFENMVPNKTIEQMKQDASLAKDQVRTSYEQNRAA